MAHLACTDPQPAWAPAANKRKPMDPDDIPARYSKPSLYLRLLGGKEN
jgi:hypothetical protein